MTSTVLPAVDTTRAAEEVRAAVHVENGRREFDGRVVLDGVELTIAPGEFVALLGASGSGKSTLLRAVAGLDRGATGRFDVPGQRAVVFQEHRLMPWSRVWRNVTLGLSELGSRTQAPRKRAFPQQLISRALSSKALRERALGALAEVGLADRADAWPRTLSGGESQRVALARALVRTPDLLLLDEPFGALDALTRLKAQSLVARLWTDHRPAVLLVTHDVEEALLLADRALLLRDGRIAEEFVVDVPRPRAVDNPHLLALRRALLAALGVNTDEEPEADR